MKKIDYHRGKRLKDVLKEKGVKHVDIIPKLNFTKQRLYQILNDPNADPNHIKNILITADIVDVYDRFPDIDFPDSNKVEDSSELSNLKNKLIDIQDKYISLLKENNRLKEVIDKQF